MQGSRDLYSHITVGYSWEFGDDNSSGGGKKPIHAYKKPGVYNVTLTVFDKDGMIGSATTTATIDGDGDGSGSSGGSSGGSSFCFINTLFD